jgi:inositol oxygenase
MEPGSKEWRAHDDRNKVVSEFYRAMRSKQTYEYVLRMENKYCTFDRPMSVFDAMLALDALVDKSDPDITLPNVQHLFQTAEAMRGAKAPEWMVVTGLVHDLGKMMFLKGCDDDGTGLNEQWGLVGDTWVMGCRIPETLVFPEYNALNPDRDNPLYNTEVGIYKEGCGLRNVHLAWGHDEYLWRVLSNHSSCKLPAEGMAMIRWHSFYPWHSSGSYRSLSDAHDDAMLPYVKAFEKYDLYSKNPTIYNVPEMIEKYRPMVERWLGAEMIRF